MPILDGKVAVVTGGASGIGAGTCVRFVSEGARVIIADLDDERGERLAAELGDSACYQHVDVTDEAQVTAAIRTAIDRWGRLDVMLSNAGRVGVWRFLEDIPLDEWDAAFALLCRSAFLGIKHASKVMRDHSHAEASSTPEASPDCGQDMAHTHTVRRRPHCSVSGTAQPLS